MRLYHVGDSGEPVRDIQGRLAALGFASDPDPPGEYAAGTTTAVRSFQEARGLDVDGIVGPDTWRSLYEAGYALGDRLLYLRSPMMRGDDVAALQRRLNDIGFDADKVDGIFGPLTHAALLDFQANRGAAEDGVAGPRTVAELAAVTRGQPQAGRERVREREWLRRLPRSVIGSRIFLDPAGRTDHERAVAWEIVASLARDFQYLGGVPVLSRDADVYPPAPVRARRANRLGAHLTLSIQPSAGEGPAVHYFASLHSSSDAGKLLARAVADQLGIPTCGRSSAMLKNTRAPAIVISCRLDDVAPDAISRGVQSFFERAADELAAGDQS